MYITFTPANPVPGKLADAELHFTEGALAGMVGMAADVAFTPALRVARRSTAFDNQPGL